MERGLYSIQEIAGIINSRMAVCNAPFEIISHLLTDSRQLTLSKGRIFFALGAGGIGHSYIPELIEKGVRNFVCSQHIDVPEDAEINIIRVESGLKALQDLAIHHRKQFSYPVLGITGSNGKTIVKEWLFQMMHDELNLVASPKSYNSQLGVPLSVWNMTPDGEMGIFEAGISLPGEMERLKNIIQPTLGIFTNIGQAHASGFSDLQHKISEKMNLFDEVTILICCSEHKEICDEALRRNIPLFRWGWSKESDIQIIERRNEKTLSTLLLSLNFKNDFNSPENLISLNIPFSDDASFENLMHCITFLFSQHWPTESILSKISRLHALEMRLKLLQGIHNCSIINDAYSLDVNSLEIALRFLTQQNQHPRKTIIISDFWRAGKYAHTFYSETARLIKEAGVNRLIGIGPEIQHYGRLFNCDTVFFDSTNEFIEHFPFNKFQNESILIKGARDFEFEKITSALQQKSHETVLEINLNALIHNLNYFKSIAEPGTKIMAMVKATSYGSGSFEIANALQFHQTDYLAVAYADEGVELRKAGISLPIMVMNPEEAAFDAILRYQLEPEIYSFRILNSFYKAWQNYPADTSCGIHLKIDTGMHRLGFLPDEINKLCSELRAMKGLEIRSVFSHLAASDNPLHDAFTRKQIDTFKEITKDIEQQLGYPFLKHILNTAGIIRFPEACFDMVRAGIGLYGISQLDETDRHLLNVNTLRSIVSQIKTVKKGETVGYNRVAKADKDTKIGVVPLGYADGLSRNLSNGKISFHVRNTPVPVIGNICMDMCMIDLSNVEEAEEGDIVSVFSSSEEIKKMALASGTIPYEILTGISGRVKRVYYQE